MLLSNDSKLSEEVGQVNKLDIQKYIYIMRKECSENDPKEKKDIEFAKIEMVTDLMLYEQIHEDEAWEYVETQFNNPSLESEILEKELLIRYESY